MAEIRILSSRIMLSFLSTVIMEHHFVKLSKYFKFYIHAQAVLCKKTMKQNVACQNYKTPFQYILHYQH